MIGLDEKGQFKVFQISVNALNILLQGKKTNAREIEENLAYLTYLIFLRIDMIKIDFS